MLIRGRNSHKQIHHLKPCMPVLVFYDRIKISLNSIGVAYFSIRKIYPVPYLKSVYSSVFAYFPGFSKTALISILSYIDQRFIQHFLSIHFTGVKMRIEISYITIVYKYQLLLSLIFAFAFACRSILSVRINSISFRAG